MVNYTMIIQRQLALANGRCFATCGSGTYLECMFHSKYTTQRPTNPSEAHYGLPSIRLPPCSHAIPHGLIPVGPFLAFATPSEMHFPRKTLPPPRLHVHRLLFAIPLLRDFCLWIGCMDVSEKVIRDRLSTNQPVALIPSGSRGIIGDADSETRHRGFLRLAYEYGTNIIPCWTPAETRIFKTWDLFLGYEDGPFCLRDTHFPRRSSGRFPSKS